MSGTQIVTYDTILSGVAATLANIPAIKQVQNYDQLTESIPETPLAQVYPDSGDVDTFSLTDRTSLDGRVQASVLVVIIDLYARTRSNLATDIRAQVDLLEAITNLFQAQTSSTPFGVAGIKSFRWSWTRATFEYGQTKYAGLRITLELTIF